MAKVLNRTSTITRNKSTSSSHSGSSANTLTSHSRQALASPIQKDQDKYIKVILKQFKKLEIGLNKFNSKQQGIITANIVRTILLPFLRSNFLTKIKLSDTNIKVYKSLTDIYCTILIKWWSSLLNVLIGNTNSNLSSIDRSAYLEGISRIISRDEWWIAEHDSLKNYNNLLVLTLDFSIHKLSTSKQLSLANAAFTGKVFAYSFFKLPNVGNALLFLLNVKQSVFENNLTNFNYRFNSDDDISNLLSIYPSHLHYLINFNGLQYLPNIKKQYINCVPPPKHPVEGIKDPNGFWVRRWLNSDSDVFNSFFRHYITITNRILAEADYPLDDFTMLRLPGLNILLSHIYQIFHVSIQRISKNNSKTNKLSTNSEFKVMNQASDKQNDIYYNSIIKVFRTLRDINYSKTALGDKLLPLVEEILISFAKDMSVYDYNMNSLVLNIIYEFNNHTDGRIFNWEFWLGCTYMMIEKTDHIQILLKNISFLFNTWDTIPDVLSEKYDDNAPHLAWLNNKSESFKENFVDWLISNKTWEKLFIHWHPIVKSYYLKLLIWRVIGINNFESTISIKITKKVEKKLLQSFNIFKLFYESNPSNYYYKPDSPLVNRKFGIMPITNKNDYLLVNEETSEFSSLTKPSELRKTHPFEIFDEAIYSCSSLPKPVDGSNKPISSNSSGASSKRNSFISNGSEEEGKQRSNSLVNSIGKLFKILTVDDNESNDKRDKLKSNPKSVSLTSLSTSYSLRSRSSSPSIMSFSSTPTSLTDFSNDSSLKSDSSSMSSSSNSQPPELFTLPPEIIRPLYKFDIAMDQDAMREKFYLMNNKKYLLKDMTFYNLPNEPKIPSTSIFINTDVYNKFYISTDNLILTDDNFNIDFETGVFENLSMDNSSHINQWITLGKALFEWEELISEFENYLTKRIESDQFNLLNNIQSELGSMNDVEYLKRIIPFLSINSSNENKLLNAA